MLATFSTTSSVTYHRGPNGALTIPGLSLLHDGGRILFDTVHPDGNVTFRHGSIAGLVGTNGCGKTSLARIISSKALPNFPQRLVVEYIAASDDEEYLAAVASGSSGERDEHDATEDADDDEHDWEATLALTLVEYIQRRIEQRSEQLSDEISSLESKLEDNPPSNDDDEVEEIVNQLSTLYELSDDLSERVQRELHTAMTELGLHRYVHQPLSKLSSGWRYKCRLVAAFLTHPDCLIVDEPSYLDDASTQWFVERTREAAEKDRAMVVLISHKEALLETLCDAILYINAGNRTLTTYRCGYATFRDTHSHQVQSASKTISDTEKKHVHAEKSLKQLRSDLKKRETTLKKTTTAHADQRFIKGKNKEAKQKADKSASSKLKRTKQQVHDLDEARRQARVERVKPLHIQGVPAASGTIVSLQDVAASYDGSGTDDDANVVFENVDAAIDATDRILLVGPNGCGKSTLVKLILDQMEPVLGSVTRTSTRNVIYFPQTALSDLLRRYGHVTARTFLGGGEDGLTETQARHHLGNFGLAKDLALRPIHTLSAGQRVRLWLAKEHLLHPKPCLIVVDEISENVDRETRDSLLDLLSTFDAAVLVISHDPDFRAKFRPTKTWELARYGLRETYSAVG